MRTSRCLCLVLGAAAAGCTGRLNESVDLAGRPPLPALDGQDAASVVRAEPSLSGGLDRSGWGAVGLPLPCRQTAACPTYVSMFRWQHDRGPWNPAWPAASAVTDQPQAGPDVADAVTQPFWAAGLLLWAPVDMVLGRWPTRTEMSPAEPYARVPPAASPLVEGWFAGPEPEPPATPR